MLLCLVLQLILAPVQFAIGKIIGELRGRTIKVTDERVGLMDEILSSIKLIKLYAWETAFANKTAEIRAREQKLLEKVPVSLDIHGMCMCMCMCMWAC